MANTTTKNTQKKLTPQEAALQVMRDRTIESEIYARFNKAEFEKMYYYLEARRIQDEFWAAVEEDKNAHKELSANLGEQIQSQVEEQNNEPSQVITTDDSSSLT